MYSVLEVKALIIPWGAVCLAWNYFNVDVRPTYRCLMEDMTMFKQQHNIAGDRCLGVVPQPLTYFSGNNIIKVNDVIQ